MNKNEIINYLNQIKPFINLKAVCDYYNDLHPDESIDYNNLRTVINRNSETRLSAEKLTSFISFLYNDLYKDIFKCETEVKLDESEINKIIEKGLVDIKNQIEEVIHNGIYYKREQ